MSSDADKPYSANSGHSRYSYPVSYTHLDVYKRQVQNQTCKESTQDTFHPHKLHQSGSEENHGKHKYEPVSYTHLDVYKRQIDTMVAILAGFIIFPAAFSVGIKPDAGPSLLFITLPLSLIHIWHWNGKSKRLCQ